MRPGIVAAIVLAVGLAVAGCTALTDVQGLCGSPPHGGVCMGRMRVPERKATEFEPASRLAIDTIASDGFRRDLAEFIDRHAGRGTHAEAWRGVEADAVVRGLMEGVQGLQATTMNDVQGLWLKLFFHTLAKEGDGGGPILINPFYWGDRADMAGTIAHEAAHRHPLLLGHPHYEGSTKAIGLCEPPYVIGSLVQRRIEGIEWTPLGHCSLIGT